jgi:hypothetical protein
MLPAIASCGHYLGDGPQCRPVGPSIALPTELRETSGVAVGVRNPDLVWTHNDGRRPFLYGFDHQGGLQARVELSRTPRDWEDIARAACELGDCLYVADTGDNAERRDNISFYRLAEPEGAGEGAADVVRYRMALPDGPRDIEAMYVLPTDQVFFVTKGRNHPVTIYRYPLPLRSGDVVTLEEVQRLTTGSAGRPQMVTGASATLDGSAVVIRTYVSLDFFDVSAGERLLKSGEGRVNLRTLGESQGEGVGLGVDGAVVLSSEGALGFGPSFTFLTCVQSDGRSTELS